MPGDAAHPGSSQWWHNAPSSDASRQNGKREEEEKEEQKEQEAPLGQQWFGERREEEGETKEGTVAFYSGSCGRSPQALMEPWSVFSVSQALDAEDKRIKQMETIMQMDERKRPYNSLLEVKAPTEEEMEAFRMKRCRPDDPMASFLGQWDLCSLFYSLSPGISSRLDQGRCSGNLRQDFWKMFHLFFEAGCVVFNWDKPYTVLNKLPTFVFIVMYQ